jgi:antitoxin component YwqK of YwqJK toxin-antitoxin module
VKIIYFPGSEKVMQRVELKNGKKNGHAVEYYSNGKIKARQYYVNDELDDTSAMYYPSGLLKSLQVYRNRMKHGCWKEYNKEGFMYSEIFFKEGSLDSTSTEYTYRTRKILTRVTYKNGRKDGVEEQYYPNGKPKSKVYYNEGSICKSADEWTEKGKKIDNSFKINVAVNNEILLKNKVTYMITLENAKSDDRIFQIITPGKDGCFGMMTPLKEHNSIFTLEFYVAKGGFVMEQVTLAAFRTTAFGNTHIQTETFNASFNHF